MTERRGWAYTRGVARIGAGAFLVSVSLGKFLDHGREAADFGGYGVPLPELAVVLAGAVELVGGLLLVLGILARPAAAAVALVMVGAIATAGVQEGGWFNLGVAPAVLVVMLIVLVWGPGRPALGRAPAGRGLS
jgi:putative oxidoreductase